MYICLCRGITEKQIEELALGTNLTEKEIFKKLGVASDCTLCLADAIKVTRQKHASKTHQINTSQKPVK